jgi:CHAD domain-containing protein
MSPAKTQRSKKKDPKSVSHVLSRKPRLNLRRTDHVGKGLRTIAVLQLRSAIAALRENHADPEAVHHARTSIKKVRAIIALVSPWMIRSEKNKLITLLSDASARLSGLRDSEVQVETLDLLLENEALPQEEFLTLRYGLTDTAKQRHRNDLRQIPRVQKLLNQALLSVADWHVDAIVSKDLKRRIRRTYRVGKKSLELCFRNKDPEYFHTWRKRVKQLWYQLRITADFWPKNACPLIHVTGSIGALAGEERDLTLLATTIREGTKSDATARITVVIETLLPKLRKKAIAKGLKFYRDSPKAFADPMDPDIKGLP